MRPVTDLSRDEPGATGDWAVPTARIARWRSSWAGGRRRLAVHVPFIVLVLVAAAVRAVVALGYPSAMFFNDSYNYLTDAFTGTPDVVRANGYPFALRLLLPAHSLSLVTGIQAALGLAIGVGIYAVLRRRGLPWWGAAIPALPPLFDVWELQIEHMIAADALFTALVTAALLLMCWRDRPPLWAVGVAGLLTGYSATVRAVGEPLLVILVAGLLARRMGWRRAAASVAVAIVAGIAPIAGYMAWFHSHYGSYALTRSTGTFLYSRVSSFAECSKMRPPQDLRVLCDPRPPGQRDGSQEYLWSDSTPLARLTGTDNIYRFTPSVEHLTMRFAVRAIESQPLSYLAVVADDTARTFGWERIESEGAGFTFRFEPTTEPVPSWVTSDPANRQAATEYGGATLGRPAVIQPWARVLWGYERYVYLRGPFLLAFVVVGAAGVALGIPRRSRVPGTGWGGPGLLPWLAGAALIVLPPMTAGFSYRYVLAAGPAICLSAGLAFAGRGNLVSWVRRLGPEGQVIK